MSARCPKSWREVREVNEGILWNESSTEFLGIHFKLRYHLVIVLSTCHVFHKDAGMVTGHIKKQANALTCDHHVINCPFTQRVYSFKLNRKKLRLGFLIHFMARLSSLLFFNPRKCTQLHQIHFKTFHVIIWLIYNYCENLRNESLSWTVKVEQ